MTIMMMIILIMTIKIIIRFDWNSEEKLLNSFAQFTTEISGLQHHHQYHYHCYHDYYDDNPNHDNRNHHHDDYQV